MTTHDGSRISRATAEHLLDGGATGAGPLAALLRAAAEPMTAAELPGQDHAVRAFRAAHLTRPHTPWRPRMLKTTIAQLIATKFAATAAVAVAATGGVALAAATGSLPAQGSHHEARGVATPSASHDAPGADDTDRPTPAALDSAAQTVADHGSSATSTSSASDGATPSASRVPTPDLSGLCKAYQAGATHDKGKAAHSAAFTVLITAAGGQDNVSAYCVTLVGEPRIRPSDNPTDEPTDEPSDEPTQGRNEPSSEPTHPTGKPSESSPGSAGSGHGSSSEPTEQPSTTTSDWTASASASAPAPSATTHEGHGSSTAH